ncbi:REP-associated tyrosine transposase [Colwellia sp. 75C3]|uniref:REP-associated tyrosine transposase n=1 Tax=Colwellia sp. 75C3 TaxID=888425 RepID=UPI001E2B09AF|nr:transposase [Colwellia sp. 75C3]
MRKGRVSLQGQSYFVTAVTHERTPLFKDFYNARILINHLKQSDFNQFTSTVGFVVMPDHFHWVFNLSGDISLSDVVGRVKGGASRSLNLSLYSSMKIWQAGFHDHCIRSDEDFKRVMRYTVANPLRANIVTTVGDYPHWDCIYL